MKIYTRTGDDGGTGLYGGDRIAKTSARIQAIGDVDELNALIGVCRAAGPTTLDERLVEIQCRLFDLGAELACPPGGKFDVQSISERHIGALERSIDEQTEKLPPLKAFILPGGSPGAASLHHARAVCRRAERSVLLLAEDAPVREEIRRFLNRLSDWLFTAARTVNAECHVMDVTWHASEEPSSDS